MKSIKKIFLIIVFLLVTALSVFYFSTLQKSYTQTSGINPAISVFDNMLDFVSDTYVSHKLKKRSSAGNIVFLQKKVAEAEKNPGKNNLNLIRQLQRLGISYGKKHEYSSAKEAFSKALILTESSYGKHHPQALTSLYQLVEICLSIEPHSEAGKYLNKILAILESVEDVEPAQLVQSLEILAGFHIKMNREIGENLKLAEVYSNRALAIRKKESTNNVPFKLPDGRMCTPITVPDVQTEIDDLMTRGLPNTVELLYLFDLKQTELEKGEESSAFVYKLIKLAEFYEKQNNDEMDSIYKRCVQIEEKSTDDESPEKADNIVLIANWYLQKQQFSKAEQWHKKALAIRKAHFKPAAEQVLWSLSDLSNVYKKWGKPAKAEAVYLDALGEM